MVIKRNSLITNQTKCNRMWQENNLNVLDMKHQAFLVLLYVYHYLDIKGGKMVCFLRGRVLSFFLKHSLFVFMCHIILQLK